MTFLPKDRTSRVIMLGFMGVMATLMVAGIWGSFYTARQEERLARTVLQREVATSVGDLQWCLSTFEGYGLQLSSRWRGSADTERGVRGMNHLTNIGVRIRDLGNMRSVVITTARGRALRARERKIVEGCLGRS
jgi:hypothetical protein